MSSAAPPVAAVSVKRSSRLHAAAKRSSRSILDADARRHAIAQRVAALEQDNHVEEAEDEYKDGDGGEEEEQVLAGAAGAKAKGGKGGKGKAAGGKRKGRDSEGDGAAGGGSSGGGSSKASKRRGPRVSLLDLVDKLGMREEGAAEPNYVSAASSAPSHPPRSFCSVCGYLSCYTCARCGIRYCSIPCQRTHNDTTCIKFGT